jgi:hypothetical protein
MMLSFAVMARRVNGVHPEACPELNEGKQSRSMQGLD